MNDDNDEREPSAEAVAETLRSLEDAHNEASEIAEEAPPRQFPTVVEFVEQFLVFAINRKISTTPGSGLRWDPNWHQYPEVVYRLVALHEAYEVAIIEGGAAPSSWWIQHLEPHMRVILDGDTGPFHAYSDHDITSAPKPLPVTDASKSSLL